MTERTKPEFDAPTGPAPAELVIRDLIEGTGDEAKPGDTVTVHYAGVEYDSGEEFDSSWGRGESAEFPLTVLIPGWQEGLQQMKPGDTFILYIPSNLGYGERGAGGSIGPNEALIFKVELISVKKKAPEAEIK